MKQEIRPADRIQQVEEYYFSSKLREIREMSDSGEAVINLGIGNPDGLPDAQVIKKLNESAGNADNHGYQPYTGTPELKEAFAEWYLKHYQVELNSATEVLPLNPGDQVLIPDPGYPAYQSVCRLVGAKPIFYDLKQELNWQADFNELEQIDLSKVKLMWVNYPNMPTGAPADRKYFEQVIDFGKRNQILIVNDNPYSFILNDQPQSLLGVAGAREGVIELNSLSKSHNMAGWRIGVVVGKPAFIQYILRIKSNMDSGMFKPLQQAAVAALQLDDQWYRENNNRYERRRKLVRKLFDQLNCSYTEDQNGLFVWASIPASVGSAREYAERILQESRVFITPGFIFGRNGENYLRASLCQPEDQIEAAMERIKTKLNQ